MEIDPEVAGPAGKRADKGPRNKALVAAAVLVVVAAAWFATGPSDVRAALEAEGHTEIQVTVRGPFDLGYVSRKGDTQCGGSVTRLPFSMSRSSSCFGSDPPAASLAPAPRPDADTLRESLTERLASVGATVRCADVAPAATHAVCRVVADAGASVEFVFDRKGAAWVQSSPERLLLRTDLADKITKELSDKAKKAITADCGAGLFGYATGDHLTCSATYAGLKKPASLEVTFVEGGGYRWTANGL